MSLVLDSLDGDSVPRKFSDKLSNIFKSGHKQGLMDYNRSNFRMLLYCCQGSIPHIPLIFLRSVLDARFYREGVLPM